MNKDKKNLNTLALINYDRVLFSDEYKIPLSFRLIKYYQIFPLFPGAWHSFHILFASWSTKKWDEYSHGQLRNCRFLI